jgi:acetyl esterase/lipase
MLRHLAAGLVAAFVLVGQGALAQTAPAPLVIDLAGSGAARSSALEPREVSPFGAKGQIVRNVAHPSLTVFAPAAGTATGSAMIIAPGGGFRFLSIDSEGEDLARRLASQGVTAFVLRYRTLETPADADGFRKSMLALFRPGGTKPEALNTAGQVASQDGRAAVRLVREQASRWNLDPKRIGVIGFSAGGWVALETAEAQGPERPNLVAAIYPAHRADLSAGPDTPPLFLSAAADDPLLSAESQLELYSVWRKARRPVELHLYAKGGHGYGLNHQGAPSDAWIEAFDAWLKAQGWLKPPR